MMNQILQDIAAKGGRGIIFGGYVRDHLLGIASKDIDIEVYHLSADDLISVLEKYGRVDLVGKSFGVLKLTTSDGQDYDFSLPRRESKSGLGHKEFDIVSDPNMSIQEAASRRDFTINAIGMDPLTNEIIDPFGGVQDLHNGILKATSKKFVEDPLRVLRGMQFAARFNMHMDEATIAMCKALKSEFLTVSKERIFEEFRKMILKGKDMNYAFKTLIDTDWISLFPSLAKMYKKNSKLVTKVAKALNDVIAMSSNLEDDIKIALFVATLYRQDKMSETPFEEIGLYKNLQVKTMKLMNSFLGNFVFHKDINTFSLESYKMSIIKERRIEARQLAVQVHPVNIGEFLIFASANKMAGKNVLKTIQDSAIQANVFTGKPEPIIKGRHLIEAGMKPGKDFDYYLKDFYENQLLEYFDQENFMDYLKNKVENIIRYAQ